MKDKRNEIHARQLIEYSCNLKKGEILYLEIKGKETLELGKEIIRIATQQGITPFWYYSDESVLRQWIRWAKDDQLKRQADLHLELMKNADAYIGLRGSDNPFDLADIDTELIENHNKLFYKPVHLEERVKRTRWVVLRYPNNAMAQLAETSQECEQPDAQPGADYAADQQHRAELDIDRPALEMCQSAGDRRGDDLVGTGGDRNGGRDVVEDQQRRHQEAAADTEHA